MRLICELAPERLRSALKETDGGNLLWLCASLPKVTYRLARVPNEQVLQRVALEDRDLALQT